MEARKTLVIDKSAIKAAPRGLIAEMRDDFDFLLTDTLLYEIATEAMSEREALPDAEKRLLPAHRNPRAGNAVAAGIGRVGGDTAKTQGAAI
jgi:hypothetical protein